MKIAATILLVLALLGFLGTGGIVGISVVSKGWYSDLISPLIMALIFFAYFMVGLLSRSKPRRGPAILGLLLLVPLVSVVGAEFDWETPALIFGGVPAAIFGLLCLIILLAAGARTKAG